MPNHGDEPQSAAAAISNASVQLMHDYTGRGPTKARTTINSDSVMILMGDILTKGERRLVERGKSDRVLQLRHDFQETMREDLIAAVETHIDRKVIAFMSANHVDPDMAAEIFVLAPEREPS